jgi:precorrin-6B methylase 2
MIDNLKKCEDMLAEAIELLEYAVSCGEGARWTHVLQQYIDAYDSEGMVVANTSSKEDEDDAWTSD